MSLAYIRWLSSMKYRECCKLHVIVPRFLTLTIIEFQILCTAKCDLSTTPIACECFKAAGCSSNASNKSANSCNNFATKLVPRSDKTVVGM